MTSDLAQFQKIIYPKTLVFHSNHSGFKTFNCQIRISGNFLFSPSMNNALDTPRIRANLLCVPASAIALLYVHVVIISTDVDKNTTKLNIFSNILIFCQI